ncbi:GntR family transcriptional regulator [Herbiconiux sp. CPCC 203407]|uniref:GntR family transcriptional regulator n=1 Tax=Herbiconiux oxytropis TaxID=2970915 RepID=A0AA41XH17_9MICO|nr:GntR family transcriptional regulator [Herbiconiux oxytropis]MCS5723942.1 GntR family transcriptional regulator [Herbiconiux oxytropis]MCS5728052.1 GntR family transcriptional regulator [Herbiconiux oxytropis]
MKAGKSPSTKKAPLAHGLKEDILELIAAEGMRPGDQLPTEPELAERFSASRSTVREALKLLEQDGLVNAIQGRGRFLSALGSMSIERPVTIYESITEMLEGLGFTVTNAVLSVTEDTADEHVAHELGLEPGDPVIRLVRLRLGNDQPMVFSINIIRRDALPGPIAYRDWGVSVTSALEGHGHSIDSSIARISAADLPADYARKHDLKKYDPWLLVEETCITRDGQRVLYALDFHRSSEIAFNVIRRR